MWQPSGARAAGPGLSSGREPTRDAHSSGQLPMRAAMSVSGMCETNGKARTSTSAELIFRHSYAHKLIPNHQSRLRDAEPSTISTAHLWRCTGGSAVMAAQTQTNVAAAALHASLVEQSRRSSERVLREQKTWSAPGPVSVRLSSRASPLPACGHSYSWPLRPAGLPAPRAARTSGGYGGGDEGNSRGGRRPPSSLHSARRGDCVLQCPPVASRSVIAIRRSRLRARRAATTRCAVHDRRGA